MNSNELFEKSKKLVPGGVHSPVRSFKGLHTTPRFMSHAKGAYINDEEGKEYIDFCMSFGPLILGHQDQEVKEELIKALDRGWTYGACEKYSLELAELIVSKIPFIDQIRFVNSGTEAVMTALRIARGHTERSKIIKFNGCYHGHTDAMLIKAGSGLAGTAQASSGGVTKETSDNTLIVDFADKDAVEKCFAAHKGEIAAIIVEPLPANNGLMDLAQDYLEFLRKITKENDTLLIFDEVISGFRVAFGGMAEKTGINPDIVTYGKIIGGGMPVGAVAAKKEIMQCLAPIGNVYQAGTLSANPMAMIAGYHTLRRLTPEFYAQLNKNSENIAEIFKEWLSEKDYKDYKLVTSGSLFWPVPTHAWLNNVNDIPSNLLERFGALFEELLNKGIYLSPNGYEVGFVSIAHDETVQAELKKRLWS
jgi:glutamate-1-semialdehyde 2,1-aminomutase